MTQRLLWLRSTDAKLTNCADKLRACMPKSEEQIIFRYGSRFLVPCLHRLNHFLSFPSKTCYDLRALKQLLFQAFLSVLHCDITARKCRMLESVADGRSATVDAHYTLLRILQFGPSSCSACELAACSQRLVFSFLHAFLQQHGSYTSSANGSKSGDRCCGPSG